MGVGMQRTARASGESAAWGIAFAIVAAVVGAAVLFRGHLSDLVGALPWFLRTYAAVIGPCEVAAALLLLLRALRLRTRRAALLAAAYAISAPLVLENLSTLPGIFGTGALAHQTPPWCWTAWHLGWAACVLAFAWLPDRPLAAPLNVVGPAFALALAFGAVAARADAWLPPVLAAGDTVSPLLFTLGWLTIGLLLVSAFGLAAFRGATLDAWLLVAVFALALDEAFVLTTSVRFSIGTYLARALGAVNAAAMLIPIALEQASAAPRLKTRDAPASPRA
jgi:hypothetical protein